MDYFGAYEVARNLKIWYVHSLTYFCFRSHSFLTFDVSIRNDVLKIRARGL